MVDDGEPLVETVPFLSTGEWEPLGEATIAEDGTFPLRIIAPGVSKNNRLYSEDLLRSRAGIYRAGTHMYWNHAGPMAEFEQPAGDLRNLAAVLVEDGRYEEAGPFGPGVYSRAKVFSEYRERVKELAPFIGISHRVLGKIKTEKVDGKKMEVVADMEDPARSVDFVTQPAAGGKIKALFEGVSSPDGFNPLPSGADPSPAKPSPAAESDMTDDNTQFIEQVTTLREENVTLREQVAALQLSLARNEARGILVEALNAAPLPAPAKDRLRAELAEPPIAEGVLDAAGYQERIKEAVASMATLVASLAPQGGVRGMGARPDAATEAADYRAAVKQSYLAQGMSEADAERLVAAFVEA